MNERNRLQKEQDHRLKWKYWLQFVSCIYKHQHHDQKAKPTITPSYEINDKVTPQKTQETLHQIKHLNLPVTIVNNSILRNWKNTVILTK